MFRLSPAAALAIAALTPANAAVGQIGRNVVRIGILDDMSGPNRH